MVKALSSESGVDMVMHVFSIVCWMLVFQDSLNCQSGKMSHVVQWPYSTVMVFVQLNLRYLSGKKTAVC